MYHRYYDSYRPSACSKNRSATIATESEAVRHHSNKRWNNSTSQGDASSAVKFSRDQSQDHRSPAAPFPNQNSPSPGHNSEQLTQLYTEGRNTIGMPDTAQSRRSSRTVDHDKRNESEAQSRGFYGSSRSPTSNVTHLGRYELKRYRDDEATDRSPKRRRAVDENEDENENENKDEGEQKELVEQAGGEHAPPKTVKLVLPSRDGSERRQPSRNVFDPHSNSRKASQLQKPTRIEQSLSKITPERVLQPLRDTPIPGTSPKGRTSTIDTSEHRTTSRQAPGRMSTPPSTRPNISPRDPRRRRDSALTPLESRLRTLQVSPEFRDTSSTKPQMLGEPPSNPFQRSPLGVGAIPSQTSGRQEEHQSSSSSQREAYAPPSSIKNNEDVSQGYGRKDEAHPSALSQNEDRPSRASSQAHSYSSQPPARNADHLAPASAPNEHSADDNRALVESRMKAFFEEDRVKQKQHEEERARERLQKRRELEHQLDEKINRLKHEADMARKVDVQKEEEEHERLMAELRQR